MGGTERAKKLARTLARLRDTAHSLPEPGDQLVRVPGLRSAYCRRLVGEKNFWLLYAIEYVSPVAEREVRVLMIVSDPQVPLD